MYNLYFYKSENKYYYQLLELCDRLLINHRIIEIGDCTVHEVSFTENQTDLMSLMTKLSNKALNNKEARYIYSKISKINKSLFLKIQDASRQRTKWLIENGYIDYRNYSRWIKFPKEQIPEYSKIKDLINKKDYKKAVKLYYKTLNNNLFSVLTPELIYLKRLGDIELSARDILYFKPKSTYTNLIKNNIEKYVSCIDKTIKSYKRNGIKLPLEIIKDNAQTIDELKYKLDHLYSIRDDTLIKYYTKSEIEKLCYPLTDVPEGRLFNRYVDQIKGCNVIEYKILKIYGLWVKFSPDYYSKVILQNKIDLVCFPSYVEEESKLQKKTGRYRKVIYVNGNKEFQDMCFTRIENLKEIEEINTNASKITYTGRKHKIENINFYEINCLEEINPKLIGNTFLELTSEIFRDAENCLREQLNLPKIGEGWISEMKMYNLIKKYFLDAEHHVSPDWLKPQHLDVYILSISVAFEYQGRQHFEPVDYFGGEESFKYIQELDNRKKKICRKNKVKLIEWNYNENIEESILFQKLKEKNIFIKNICNWIVLI